MWVTMEIEALRELSEEELIDRLGEVRQFIRDLKEENQNILSLLDWGNKSEIDEQQIISALMISGGREVTPGKDIVADQESQDALNKATERRARFKFSMVGLTTGDVITYIKMPGINATICSDTKILFEGEEVSVSHATMALLERQGVHWKSVRGQQYWEDDGETLSQRRRRMEAE
jgi:hypothetical protein